MNQSLVEIGSFNRLILVARIPEIGHSSVANFLRNTCLKQTGGVLWLTPYNRPCFDEQTLELACANTLAELVQQLPSVIGPTVRPSIWGQFWEKAPADLCWHIGLGGASEKPVIELVVATKETMGKLVACWHCEQEDVFT